MTILYVAEDGTEFDNLSDCLSYEKKCNTLPPSVQFFDDAGRIIIPEGVQAICDAYSDCYGVRILDIPSRKKDTKFLYDYYGFRLEDLEPGDYRYNYNTMEWEPISINLISL